MTLQGFYTNLGQALAAKIAAGTAPLTITRVVAGSGRTEDIPSAASLPDIQQTLTVGEAQVSGTTVALPVTLAEAQAEQNYQLTELGVYADDPDGGEVLFQVYQLSSAVAISVGGESVLRFYLRQSIGAQGVSVTCSPSGMLLDVDLAPVRNRVTALEERVTAASVPSRTVSVAAADLQAYLDALPKLLSEHLTIEVGDGTISSLTVTSFYGSGTLTIKSVSGNFTVANSANTLTARECTAKIFFNHVKFQSTSSSGSAYSCYLVGSRVYFIGCTFSGQGYNTGLTARELAWVLLEDCIFQGNGTAINCLENSLVVALNCSATDQSTGGRVSNGGILILSGSTPALLGGSTNVKSGGLLVKADGTVA